MLNMLGKILAIFVLIISLFIVPVMNSANSQDDIIQSVAYKETTDFKDKICTQAKITQSSYLEFVNNLNNTGLLYDIEMVVTHSTVVPVYNDEGIVVKTKTVEQYTYTDEILKKVYSTDGVFELDKGDTISIIVTNKEQTLGQRLRIAVLHIPDYGDRILITVGGMVRDEDI